MGGCSCPGPRIRGPACSRSCGPGSDGPDGPVDTFTMHGLDTRHTLHPGRGGKAIAMSPRRKLTDDRRIQILDAAARVIVRRGLADTRITDIAEAAGTSPGLVLYYFASKDRLLAEALTVAEERFYQDAFPELERIDSARERLVRLIELTCTDDSQAGGLGMDEYLLWLDLWARAPRDP